MRFALGMVVALSGGFAFILAGGGIQAASAYVRPGGCSAGFVDEHPDAAQAVIEALPTTLCTDQGQYRFSIWATQSDVYATSFPQHLIAAITSPDANGQWVLPFVSSESPTCFFQVDFGMKSPNVKGKAYYPLSSLMGEIPGCVPH
jgi:hypothetical protein